MATMSASLRAQMKITDGTNLTMDQNSILELESSNKGFLPPRVTINNIYLPAPLSAPVPAGMVVYSAGGAVTDGFYYWTGSKWLSFNSSKLSVKEVSANVTLTKKDNFVLAKNDITVTLPIVSAADSGLAISVNNVGTYADYILVAGSGGATIDGQSYVPLIPYNGYTFVARGTNWVVKDRPTKTISTMDVGQFCPWATIEEAVEFLKEHMYRPATIRLSPGTHLISKTVIINLPYDLTIEGLSFGEATIGPTTGMTGKPLFRCKTNCYFKMIQFDASTLTGYGSNTGDDAIRLLGSGTYNEIKDCSFDGFKIAVQDSTNAELWFFENDVSNSGTGVKLHSSNSGVMFRASETDFFGCAKGIDLSKGSSAYLSLMSLNFDNQNAIDSAIIYRPLRFSFSTFIVRNNSWNYVGAGLSGLDFTRSDGRDADAIIENNSTSLTSNPHCKVNVVNNSSTTNLGAANTWTKAVWTNTSSMTNNMVISNNKVTKLGKKSRDMFVVIAGNVMVNNSNRIITVGLVKNGVTTTRYGETTLRIVTANQAFQFSTVIYLESVAKDDYFEFYASSTSGYDQLTFQDMNIYFGYE
jgi:hypothetical protein